MAHVCPGFLSLFLDNRLREWLFRPDRILGPFVRRGMTAADIGCGPGFFTIPLARMVGPGGRVIAVDVQTAMLDRVRRKAASAGLEDRLTLHRCEADSLGLPARLDFVLCFWMMHEAPSPDRLLTELAALLKPGAPLLLAEPWAHVSRKCFDQTLASARRAGLTASALPKIRGSYAALLNAPGLSNASASSPQHSA
jgi:ubiquinone/menaquinone biosynthesis C-methylase UbiE